MKRLAIAALCLALAGCGSKYSAPDKLTYRGAVFNLPTDWCWHQIHPFQPRLVDRCIARTAVIDVPRGFARSDIAKQISDNREERAALGY